MNVCDKFALSRGDQELRIRLSGRVYDGIGTFATVVYSKMYTALWTGTATAAAVRGIGRELEAGIQGAGVMQDE